MARTVNLGLYVTPSTDMNTDVLTWIKNVAGDNATSNMALIDAAFKDLADGLYQYIDTNSGLYAFHVDENGDLILTYETESMPPFEIDENGCLILTIRGASANLGRVTTNGANGVTFRPYMDGSKLCWSNDGGLVNPDPVDLALFIDDDSNSGNSGEVVKIDLDETLTVSGEAADAKATGDAIATAVVTASEYTDEKIAEANTYTDTQINAALGDINTALENILGSEAVTTNDVATVTESVGGYA